jgi:hypothetical protein
MFGRGTERTKGWRMPAIPRREVERMLSERRSFGVIEDRIDRMAVTDDLKRPYGCLPGVTNPLPTGARRSIKP